MKVFITPGGSFDGSFYLEEILRAFGLPCVERSTLPDALQRANPQIDVLILPHGSDTTGLAEHLQSGASVVAIRPPDELAALVSLRSAGERKTPGRLRLVAPICAPAGGESLWTLGAQTIYIGDLAVEESAASTLAYLLEAGDYHSESAGILQRAVVKGMLTVFAYDPAVCIMRLRQGWPQREGVLPPGEAIPRSTFLHEPDAPYDTLWRPTADLHALAFCDVVTDLLSRRAPAPALWHFPHGKDSVVLFSGDEDGAPQEHNDREMAELESRNSTMSLYVIPEHTSITRELVEEYSRRGHEISAHPDLTPACGKSKEEQLAKAEADAKLIRKTFGVPVETVRNHCGMWPGYLDLPELWERLGIGLDASCIASLLYQSPEVGPYVHLNAALPLRFVREDGSLIDVLQQPTHLSDDLWCHPNLDYSQKYSPQQFDWVISRILEDAAHRFHVPYCPVIHPWSYNTYSGEHGRSLMSQAQRLDIPLMRLDHWQNFWRARASWQMSEYSYQDGRMNFVLAGSPCEGLYLTLPSSFDGRSLSTLSFNNEVTSFEVVERFKRHSTQAPVPAGAHEINVVAEYSD